jgi:hypothetical protein
MINIDMKISEILCEGATDLVAKFYKEASKDFDQFQNLEDFNYKNKNKEYYDLFFKDWFDKEITPVFRTPVLPAQDNYTNIPTHGKLQSPGFRGLNYALAKAGLPYNHKVQDYDPSVPISNSANMDAASGNNGE